MLHRCGPGTGKGKGKGKGGKRGGTGTTPARRRGRGAWDNQKDSASAAGGPRCWAGPVQRLDSSEVPLGGRAVVWPGIWWWTLRGSMDTYLGR
ncbi:hypothetical protein GQ607_015181 [Colletotrichum asianum]|uniref:Uncharacterized protein n=1 Tax=Colletotrichum asianum TaxID=702518 RepID=A0A8H3ZN25_9PEZI|nr:hypothetical protein GQ607_015181 [Colletotrichum asianum]